MVIRARIVQIGNSRGVRLPKHVLEQTRLSGEVELDVQQDHIVIRPARRPRAGWDEQFEAMAERGDDRWVTGDPPTPTHWDETEWEW
jgi:antitoxin MazE